MTAIDLMEHVRALREEQGLTQGEVARRLDVTQGSVSQAERDPSTRLNELRLRIVELLTGRKVTGPFWAYEDELQ
ncbi:MAG: helix-turn-helix transcriptional regulator [Bacteroidota bacterium]